MNRKVKEWMKSIDKRTLQEYKSAKKRIKMTLEKLDGK